MNAADETKMAAAVRGPNRKLALVLLAHHHGSENIASQRFRGLLRHLPRDQHSVHVLTGPWLRPASDLEPEVTTVAAPLLCNASTAARLAVLGAMLCPRWLGHGRVGGESWVARTVDLARARVRAELAAGNRVVVMATYSPVDALIAARLVAQAESVPLVQDFRDGLEYESLGRKGSVFRYLRRVLEGWAVRPAARITSVTRPLVDHFTASYPGTPADLLYNGYDCPDNPVSFAEGGRIPYADAEDLLVGHFGRVTASDGGSHRSFQQLLHYLARGGFSGQLAFFGTLTETERAELSGCAIKFNHFGHLPREEAIARMRDMNALLLITSDRASVATGKIFEYLFSGPRIVLATLRRNEAAKLLDEIGDDDLVLDFSDPTSIPEPAAFAEHLRRPFTRNRERIQRFEKSAQALELAAILQAAATAPIGRRRRAGAFTSSRSTRAEAHPHASGCSNSYPPSRQLASRFR